MFISQFVRKALDKKAQYYAKLALEHGFTKEQVESVIKATNEDLNQMSGHKPLKYESILKVNHQKMVQRVEMEKKAVQMVKDSLKTNPAIIGVEHNALVCDVGGGRIMLIAMSDLADVEELERMKAESEAREVLERIEQQTI